MTDDLDQHIRYILILAIARPDTVHRRHRTLAKTPLDLHCQLRKEGEGCWLKYKLYTTIVTEIAVCLWQCGNTSVFTSSTQRTAKRDKAIDL